MEDIRTEGEWAYMVLDARRSTREFLRVRSGLPLPGVTMFVYTDTSTRPSSQRPSPFVFSRKNVPVAKGVAFT